MISLGMLPVPEHMYQPKDAGAIKRRYIRPNEKKDLISNIINHRTLIGDSATSAFIYYEMLSAGEIPTDDGIVLITEDNFSTYYKFAGRQMSGKHIKETKICAQCGNNYERKLTTPANKWKKQTFCSKKCAVYVTISKRIFNANERKKTTS